ncbi:nucleotide-binding protein [Oxyplasma meridianum]|uniref:Nucleotide-binding protein n=1 Tax=Oxyplasma meridianum TaxID=3073602 RepID=A0AAX4NJF3_9ARCH
MDKICPGCKTNMKAMGNMNFRVGGYTGIGGMFLGGWNELSEKTQTFALYKCYQCGRIDFYEPEIESSGEKKHHFL